MRPTTDGSEANRDRHTRSLRITTSPRPFAVLVGGERPADRWCDAHHLEERRRDANAEERHRIAGAGEVHAFVVNHRRQPVERSVAARPLRKLVSADDVLCRVGPRFPDEGEAIGISEWQRPQQHGIDDAEDEGGAADRQGEKRHDRQR